MRRNGLRPGARFVVGAIAAAAFALALAGSAHGSPGTWERAWGGDVDSGGGTAFEICTVAASCKAGINTGVGGEMNGPTGVAVDSAGNVYVADYLQQRIQKFDASGNFLRAWGKNVITGAPTGFEICTVAADCKAGEDGGLAGEFSNPYGVAVDANDDVYVADGTNNRIQVFDSQGTFKRMWGKDVVDGGGSGPELCETAASCQTGLPGGQGGEMEFPSGIDFESGFVYVAENGNMRVQVFDRQGNFQRLWGRDAVNGGGSDHEVCTVANQCQVPSPPYGVKGGEMYGPNDVAVGGGKVYVTDSANQRIQVFDTLGNFQQAWGQNVIAGGGTGYEICTVVADCTFADNDGLAGAMGEPDGIVRSASGEVYLADNGNQRVQVYGSAGNFLRTWGKDVILGAPAAFEICTSAPACQYGFNGSLGGELSEPAGLALTPSGALYVGDADNNRVQKFAADSTTAPPVVPPAAAQSTAAPKRCKKKKRKPRAAAKKCKKKKKKKR
jgi:tripartite motif-containing protein 71